MSDEKPVPGLYWSIRRSFAAYVARLPDGHVTLDDGASLASGDRLLFPACGESSLTEFAFAGAVRFSGHVGLLSVKLANPRISLDPATETGMLSTLVGEAWQPLVSFAYRRYLPTADAPIWGRQVRLAAEGVELFGGNYQEGDGFDEFMVIPPA